MKIRTMINKTYSFAIVVGALTMVPYSTNACQKMGMYPMMGGMGTMGGMSLGIPMAGNVPYYYPTMGMPWVERSHLIGPMYMPSGMYPMYGDPRYMAQPPQQGMPWSGSATPTMGSFGMLPMGGGMVAMPPMTAGVQQQFPMYGMPWNLYNQQGTGEPVPMYTPSGMYPMTGYPGVSTASPMYGMPWVQGR